MVISSPRSPRWMRNVRVSAERRKVYAVTGGTGFLGAHLVQRLLRDGHAVRMLVRTHPDDAIGDSGMSARGDVERVFGALDNDKDLRELMLQQRHDGNAAQDDHARTVVDGVYHLAGLVMHSRRNDVVEELQSVNVDGAVRVVRVAMELGVARACIASTSGTVEVRARVTHSVEDEIENSGDGSRAYAEIAYSWPYYASKIAMEIAISTMTKAMEDECLVTEIVMVRPSLLLGPGDRRLSSCKTVADLLKKRLPIVPPGGLNFVDVRDAADATIAAFEKGDNGKKYLVAGPNLTTERFFQEVTARANVPMPKLKLPAWLTIFIAKVINAVLTLLGRWNATFDPVLAEMGCAFWYVDDSSAAESCARLGIHMRDWGTTLDDTIEWLRKQEEQEEEAKAA